MKKSKGEIAFYIILIISLVMLNPPILNIINKYAYKNPLTFGFPTLWVWLEFWYIVLIIDFLVSAIKLKSWKIEY